LLLTYLPTYLLSHLYCDIVLSDSRRRRFYLGSKTVARSEPSSTVLFRNTFTYLFIYLLFGDQSVSAADPRVWKNLPPHLRQDAFPA